MKQINSRVIIAVLLMLGIINSIPSVHSAEHSEYSVNDVSTIIDFVSENETQIIWIKVKGWSQETRVEISNQLDELDELDEYQESLKDSVDKYIFRHHWGYRLLLIGIFITIVSLIPLKLERTKTFGVWCALIGTLLSGLGIGLLQLQY